MKLFFNIFCLLIIIFTLTYNLFAQGYVCAVGGGSENYNSWSDAPYSWIVQKADSGKVIILGTSSATTWLPNYFMSLGADTAYNKTIGSLAAADIQETYDELITAKAIFIRGGDQLTNSWKYDLNNRQIAFISPSAKEVDTQRTWQFPQTNFWLTGSDNITQHLQTSFSNFIANGNPDKFVIISHPGFSTQLNTLISFLNQGSANYEVVYLNNSMLDDPVISQTIGDATNFVFAGDSLNILSSLNDTATLIGGMFNQKTLVDKTPVFFFGKSGKIAGQYYTDNLYTDVYAAYRGKMTNNAGLNLFGDFIFEPMLYDASDMYENRMSSVLWGMMRNRSRFGVYLHGNAMSVFNTSQKTVKGYGSLPPIYIDASQTTYVDSSTFIASGGVGPRQSVAMNNLRYSITTWDGYAYLIEEGKFDYGTSVNDVGSSIIKDFVLYQNYPNPFNPVTKISWQSSAGSWQSLKLFDILGNELATLIDEYRPAGRHEIEFNSQQITNNKQISSGVYFYRLTAGDHSETKSMILMK